MEKLVEIRIDTGNGKLVLDRVIPFIKKYHKDLLFQDISMPHIPLKDSPTHLQSLCLSCYNQGVVDCSSVKMRSEVVLEEINEIMWGSYMKSDRDFSRVEGKMIMEKLENYFDDEGNS